MTITMPENATTTGLYRPNGTLTANGLSITAHAGIFGDGTRDSYTDLRIFSNGSGIDEGDSNGSLGATSSIAESEIVMAGNGTALTWDENGPYQGTLDASFLTIVGDGTAGGVGVESFGATASGEANVVLTNSIVQNFATSLRCTDASSGSAAVTVGYSDFNPASESNACSGGITAGGGDINANPDLIAQANGDEVLAFNSPAIDAGDPTIAGPLNDLAGNPRPVNTGAGSRVDMGAFQYQLWRAPTAVAAASSSSVAAGTPVTFTAAGSSDPDATGLSYSWSFDDGGSATGASVQHAFSQVGTHSATVTVTNSLGLVAMATAPVTVTTPVATASAGSPTVTGTTVSDDVTCTGDSGATCTVTLSLDVTETLKGGKVIAVTAKAKGKPKKTHRTILVGTASVSLHAGQSQTVTVKLNSVGQSLLKKRHSLAAKFTATGGTSVLATQTVTFKKPKGKKKR